jgi:hypothetical protein
MDALNFDHAMSIYKDIKKGKKTVTTDFGQLYFAIALLGDEVIRLQKDIAKENTALIRKKKK